MKKYKYIFLAFLFSIENLGNFAAAQSVYEQIGKLPITTYLPDEYVGYAQVWSAVKGDNGLMYFGTSYGLHEYDGVSWRSVFEYTFTDVRCLGKDQSGRIFYSGTEAFGYLEVNQYGVTQPVSLFHLIPEEYLPTGTILTSQFIDNYIFLQSMNYIFRMELDTDLNLKSLKSWKPETGFMYSFLQDGILYIHQIDKGLYRLVEDELTFIQGTEVLGKERLRLMLPYFGNHPEKNYLLGSYNSGFYLFDGENLKKFPTQIDAYLRNETTLNIGLLLEDGNYLLSLMGSGAAIMNTQGEIIRIIDSNHGLPSDLVIGTYLDNVGSLWILTEDGIARVDVNSPALDYGKDVGIKSFVYVIEKIEDEIYLGTHHGLLKFDQETKVFKAIPEISTGQISDLLLDGNDLIIPGEKLQVLRNDKLIPLENPKSGSLSLQIHIPKKKSNILYVGTTSGLSVYRRGLPSEVPWEYIGEVAGVNRAVYFLNESKDGDLWVGTQTGVAFHVTTQDNRLDAHDLEGYKVKSFEGEGNAFIMLVNGEIYWPSDTGLQRFSKSEGKFVKANEFDHLAVDFYGLYEDPLKRVWLITEYGDLILVALNEDGIYEKFDYKGLIGSIINERSFLDTDSSMWFGRFGLVRFDPKKDLHREKPFFTLLRRIETKTDTLELIQYGRNTDLPAKELKDNSFKFEFAAPFFDGEKNFAYQTFLEGYDPDWVDWNYNNFKEYTNLPPGNYVFRVRARNTTLTISEDAVFSFTVLPPWWRTWWAYLIYSLLLLLAGLAVHKYQKERTIRKERERSKDRELEQARKIEEAYTELKSTQAQLIQSEKMASLGELTAGIAHEIQNPLNFVNNFSEISNELVDEMKEEQAAGNWQLATEIAGDIKQNLEKINHHGKRAADIVKGMLQHSRTSSGQKEPTDINALADEYLRLSYHGLRAKDKSFNADFKTDFDESLPKINVIPQDIGRVLLNLINNAFYAVDKKAKEINENYNPLVVVETRLDSSPSAYGPGGQGVKITVKDNGPGIPLEIKDKIFQPFFTTKPTGQGTGLGLSLAYDIVKAHGGEIKVETKEGEGSTFSILITVEQ